MYKLILACTLICVLSETHAQKQPDLETTIDWLGSKMKPNAKRILIPVQKGFDQYNIRYQSVYSGNDRIKRWKFEGPIDTYSKSPNLVITPINLSSCKIVGDTIFLHGLDLAIRTSNSNQSTETSQDDIRIIFDFSTEENLASRMKKAFEALILLKKKSATQSEPY